jgi:small-conductance mechanosensitive channel
VGDTITAAGVSGAVDTIGMFSTVIMTPDNVVITVPNSLVTRHDPELHRRAHFRHRVPFV